MVGGRAVSYGRRVLVSFANAAGVAFARMGRPSVAVQCHRWALSVADNDASLLVVRALTWNEVGVSAKTAGRLCEAQHAYDRSVALMSRAVPEAVPAEFSAVIEHNRAGLALACGDPIASEAHARAALRARRVECSSPEKVANDVVVLAEALAVQKRDDEARILFYAALATYESANGPNHYEVGVTHVHLGALEARHDADRARDHYERALVIKMRTRGARHPEVGIVHNNLGALHREQGNDVLAREHYTVALDLIVRRYGRDHPAARTCRTNLERLGLSPVRTLSESERAIP
jgi:tetratricopeptide (TPR) repeat protein